jgi:hypothetical protein
MGIIQNYVKNAEMNNMRHHMIIYMRHKSSFYLFKLYFLKYARQVHIFFFDILLLQLPWLELLAGFTSTNQFAFHFIAYATRKQINPELFHKKVYIQNQPDTLNFPNNWSLQVSRLLEMYIAWHWICNVTVQLNLNVIWEQLDDGK